MSTSTLAAPGRAAQGLPETPASPGPDRAARGGVSRRRLGCVLLGAQLGLLLAALDQTIVGTAMPRIIADLNGFQHYAWVATAYLLAATVCVPIYGKLSDLYGRRPFFLGGMALFLLGSALAGTSHSMTQLIAFRALQGLGGGAIMPIVQMLFGVIVSSVVGGQLLARTGRYKHLAVGGLAVASGGLFLLSRLNGDSTQAEVVRDLVVTGLGIGASMTLFTIVVQNALPAEQLGQVTANLQLFREIGGTVGVAVLGTVMTNRFQGAPQRALPASFTQVVPADRLAPLQNPQVLLSPEATAALRHSFAAFGPQGDVLLGQLTDALRAGLTGAISEVFAAAAFLVLLGAGASLFLREIPLRKRGAPTAMDGAGGDR